MSDLSYMELNLMQIYDVLRQAAFLRLGVCSGRQPYVIPMAYQLEIDCAKVILHLASPALGRKTEAVRVNPLVCAEIELPGCGWLDTVVAEGRLTSTPVAGGVHWQLHALSLSGRRYFQPAT